MTELYKFMAAAPPLFLSLFLVSLVSNIEFVMKYNIFYQFLFVISAMSFEYREDIFSKIDGNALMGTDMEIGDYNSAIVMISFIFS